VLDPERVDRAEEDDPLDIAQSVSPTSAIWR